MKRIYVYCPSREGRLLDIGPELLTKARALASELEGEVGAILTGERVAHLCDEVASYGATRIYTAEEERLAHYATLPYAKILCEVMRQEKPEIFLLGATSEGRDLAPRVAAELQVGCTADCTELRLGDYTDRSGIHYEKLLLKIRPSFLGNSLTTIVAPETRPQMATVREGVVRKERLLKIPAYETRPLDCTALLGDEDFVIELLSRTRATEQNHLKQAEVVVAGGYGVGSKENFALLEELASLLGGEVGGTRPAVDAGFLPHNRMIGQTGLTVAPKLYLAFGISGQVQHTVGMDRSGVIVAINNDPEAPICKIADYTIIGDAKQVAERMIRTLKQLKR